MRLAPPLCSLLLTVGATGCTTIGNVVEHASRAVIDAAVGFVALGPVGAGIGIAVGFGRDLATEEVADALTGTHDVRLTDEEYEYIGGANKGGLEERVRRKAAPLQTSLLLGFFLIVFGSQPRKEDKDVAVVSE